MNNQTAKNKKSEANNMAIALIIGASALVLAFVYGACKMADDGDDQQ